MKKVFFLFAWLLTCVCTVQVNAGNVITRIGSNITDVSQITNGSYYIFKSAQYGFLYENATTGRIDMGSGAVVGAGAAYIWQAHAEDGGKFSFSAASGKYISTPLNPEDVYTVNASSAAKDKFAISDAGAGKWKLKSSNDNIYWDSESDRFVGWRNPGANSLFEIIPVEVQAVASTTPVLLSALPDTKTTTVATGYYMLKQVNTSKTTGWFKANSLEPGTNVVVSSASLTASDPNIVYYIWYVEKQSDGSITIANGGKTAAWDAPSTRAKPLVAYGSKANLYLHSEAVTLGGYTATANEGSFLLSDANTHALVHESGGVLGSWTDANPESVFMVEFYPIEESNLTNGWMVNYIYTLSGTSSTVTKTVFVADGAIPSAPALDVAYLTNNSLDKVDAINCNCAIRVACSENLPFVKTTNDSDPNYYALLMHQNTNNDGFVKYSALDTQLTADHATANIGNYAENYATLLNEDGYWWYFKGNVLDGFQIFNKAAGTENNRKMAYGTGGYPIIKENPASYTWKLAKSTHVYASAKDWTCIGRTDNGNYMNLQDGAVKYWSDADNGSSFKFYTPLDIATMTADEFNLMQNYLGAPDGALLGSRYVEQHRAEMVSAKGQNANNLAAVKTLRDHKEAYNASLDANELNDGLVAGKYYRLYNAGYGKYLTVDPSNSKLVGTQLEEGLKKNYGSVIYIAENGDAYTLSAQGKYFGSVATSQQVALSDAVVDYTIQHTGARFAFNGGNGQAYGCLHTRANGDVVGWETGAVATHWYVMPATDIQVALNEVDGAYYGTLYVPFAVKVADSDAASKLYTGSVNAAKDGLVMSKQGTVPAGTGIVIASDNNTATLDITTATGTLASDLQGTYRTMTENLADYLYLGKSNTDNKLGFYANGTGLTSVAANKAFLPKNIVNTLSLRMFFNDDVTGINGIEIAGDSAAPVFDLSGRRVMRTVKGGVYISNGKKFIAR